MDNPSRIQGFGWRRLDEQDRQTYVAVALSLAASIAISVAALAWGQS